MRGTEQGRQNKKRPDALTQKTQTAPVLCHWQAVCPQVSGYASLSFIRIIH